MEEKIDNSVDNNDKSKEKIIKDNNIKGEENNKNINKLKDENDKEINNEKEKIDVDKMTLEQLLSGIPQADMEQIKKTIKENMPQKLDELFIYKINWEIISKYELKRKKIKKYIEECLLKYFDEVDSFTKFILEKLGVISPLELQNKLKYVLEENTEVSIYFI